MSLYILIHRLRWPTVLLLTGGIALLRQLGIVDHFWHWYFPLLLILLGVLMLIERAAMAYEGDYQAMPSPGAPRSGWADYRATADIPAYPGQPEPFIPPQHREDPEKDAEGGSR
jgi:hypothetical protein